MKHTPSILRYWPLVCCRGAFIRVTLADGHRRIFLMFHLDRWGNVPVGRLDGGPVDKSLNPPVDLVAGLLTFSGISCLGQTEDNF
jgi:hypothetical protein